MIEPKRGFASSEVNHGSSRVLFVEGESNSLDFVLMSFIFTDVKVRAIGPSSNIKAAARAFSGVHPSYFFVVDRDHQEDSIVEATWKRFKTGESNLVIWRKKEIENYFLDPSMLCSSEFILEGITEEHIIERIVAYAKANIYMFAANRVVIRLREELKYHWIDQYVKKEDFPDKEAALHKLMHNDKIQNKPTEVKELFSTIEALFESELGFMLGEDGDLQWGKGKWLELMPAKKILHELLNDSKLFIVRDNGGKKVEGKRKQQEILARLLSNSENWPEDFRQLKAIISTRV